MNGQPVGWDVWLTPTNMRLLVSSPQPGSPWTLAIVEHADFTLRINQPLNGLTGMYHPVLDLAATVKTPVVEPLGGVLGPTYPSIYANT